jgi:hypothetical protein
VVEIDLEFLGVPRVICCFADLDEAGWSTLVANRRTRTCSGLSYRAAQVSLPRIVRRPRASGIRAVLVVPSLDPAEHQRNTRLLKLIPPTPRRYPCRRWVCAPLTPRPSGGSAAT